MSELSPEHKQDLEKSGLNDEMIQKANLYSVPPGRLNKILGPVLGSKINSALAFPYTNCNGFIRYKLFDPVIDKDGHRMKYFQPPGSGTHIYLPPGIENEINDPSIPLSIVEGEKKALKGYQEGIFTIGIGGIWNFKEKGSEELIPDFDAIPLNNRVINLIPDGDYHRNKNIQKAVLFLAKKLKEKGAIPYLILLPDSDAGKIGFDDFLVKFDTSEFWELPRDEIITDPYERLYLPSSLEISQMDVRIEWIVKNLIPKESITLLHSIGGVGKSYLMLEIARCVAENEPFCDLDVVGSRVHYIDFENPLPELVDRTKKSGGSENLKIWHLGHDPAPVRFDSAEWEIYKAFPPGLFVIDSLRSCHLLEENSSKDAAFVMARFKEIRSRGNALVLIHHETKLGGYRGSTAWFDLSDHILKFGRVKSIGSDEDTEDDDLDLPIRLGLGGKSRFSSAMDFNPLFFKFIDKKLCPAKDPDTFALERIGRLFENEIYYNELFRKVQDEESLKNENSKGELKPMGKARFSRLVRKGYKMVPPRWKREEFDVQGRPRVRFLKY